MTERIKHSRKWRILLVPVALLLCAVIYIYWLDSPTSPKSRSWQAGPQDMNALELALQNYGDEVKRYAQQYDVPYEYLMALMVLESSGRKPAGARFEPGVMRKLEAVRAGERRKYENVRQKHLEGASDEALQNLATSWGPFQLMGYKCIGLEVNVSDIRGDSAVKHGVRWISQEYGKYLKKEKFKDAFHIHNTGRKYPTVGKPKTHDPRYVDRGLEYMEWFRKR